MHAHAIEQADRPVIHNAQKPKAVGLVRTDVSGLHAPRHATEIRRHAEQLGYHYLYTVRPPEREPDPIGYALTIAIGVHAATLVVHDLTTVNNTPARVCEICDLETVCPAVTWALAQPGAIGPAHTYPDHELTVAQSHRIMQQHKTCRAIECPRKAAALSCLVRAGKLVPPASSPRERAATRGLRFEPAPDQLPVSVGPDMQTLLDVLDALTDPRTLVIRPCENMRSERE
jgi:hypothetical protein